MDLEVLEVLVVPAVQVDQEDEVAQVTRSDYRPSILRSYRASPLPCPWRRGVEDGLIARAASRRRTVPIILLSPSHEHCSFFFRSCKRYERVFSVAASMFDEAST